MANFDLCYSFLLPNEDYDPPHYEAVSDPTESDPGAQAISGINSAFWPQDFHEIAALPVADRVYAVKNFYRVHYWNRWLEALTSNRIAAMTLDASVNQGAGWGARFLQGACGATADGILGPATVWAANNANPEQMVARFIELREARYRAVGGPSLPQWLARAAKIPSFT